jgi:hypothetical protein
MNSRLEDLDNGGHDGAQLLDELHAQLAKFVIFPSSQAHNAAVLWTAATHAQPVIPHAPRLLIKSAEKRSGKTRLLEVIREVAYRRLVTVNISAAALVRSIKSDDPPTLFVDEVDRMYGSRTKTEINEDLTAIIDAGFSHGWPYTRYNAARNATEEHPTFCMVAMASKNVDLPDTVEDRSVMFVMQRRKPDERIASFRERRDIPPLHDLRDRLHEGVRAHVDELADAEPKLPVDDRAADTWEALVMLADLAGGLWPDRARTACLRLCGESAAADDSIGVRLLDDIKEIFDELTVSFVATGEARRCAVVGVGPQQPQRGADHT